MKSNPTHIEELDLVNAPLGKKSQYIDQYTPGLLFPISRVGKRIEIGINGSLPFSGYDIWNAFEISWLNLRGKPVVALGEFTVPCNSPSLIESKSFKLYLNSLNNSRFASFEEVSNLLKRDLSAASGAQVGIRLIGVNESIPKIGSLQGSSLDILDIDCDSYAPKTALLTVSQEIVEETLYSDLLKSNCLVTGQPDWGSVQIKYFGKKIDHEGLLRYIVSFRNHNEFHEQCVERIFVDITEKCRPEKLAVMARYTRRGGLDINPYRASHNFEAIETALDNQRLVRQ